MKNFFFIFVLVLFFVASCTQGVSNKGADKVKVTVFKSPNCGCCSKYIPYLESKGFDVKTVITEDITKIKAKYGVPSDMESCHTMVLDDYFVEGHVPIEAIEKLLAERPDIDGISLPSMLAGSPGMPGVKSGPFTVYSIKNGEKSEFMRI